MPARKGTPVFEEVLSTQREQMLDQYGRALAGVQGRPPDSSPADEQDEYTAWTTEDKNVTPEHLQQIAVQTAQELSQQTNEDGSPMWTPEQIAVAVQGRQTLAQYPFRHLTYTLGVEGLENQITKATQVAKRVAARQQKEQAAAMQAGGWQPIDEADIPPRPEGMMG